MSAEYLTEAGLAQAVDGYFGLVDLAVHVGDRIASIRRELGVKGDTTPPPDDASPSLYRGESCITLTWDEHWRYGGHERVSLTIPFAYLTDSEWEAKYRADIERQQAADAASRAAAQLRQAVDREAHERAEYERLREKFEGKPT